MVEIIVPVYNAADDLARCLAALARHTPATQPITLVNDASTDPAVRPQLINFVSRRPAAQLLENPQNLGFVKTVNRAMAAGRQDVILLNSDAVVTTGWLPALTRCAESDGRIATVTPFSNNAEICSLPEFCQNNPFPDDPDAWGRRVAGVASRTYPELPTGVGFCMLIRRRALDELGLFDEAFGRGYGEENDFCCRASEAGGRNVLCDDAYVAHAGGRSFAPLGLKPNGDNLALLLDRFPDYEARVAAFIQRDPLAPIRQAILASDNAGAGSGG
ncbi:MAG: glycosyltransferase family 2 protein [Pseudomonadota bacterium]